jgi:RluA family pseudouridine synthase
MITLAIGEQEAGMRLDRLLRKRLALRGLSDIYRLLRTGAVRVNGRRRRQNYRLQHGETVVIDLPEAELTDGSARAAEAASLAPLAGTEFFRRNFRVLFEDRFLLACDKPSRLVVHSGTGHTGHDSLIDLAAAYLSANANGRRIDPPDLAHRIDKDTSGVIVLAKDKQTLRGLHDQIRAHAVRKRYRALCRGAPPRASGTIAAGLRRTHRRNEGMKMAIDRDGPEAISSYRILDERRGISRAAIEIHTGKTHQIRAHMAHLGAPVLGDVRYGTGREDKAFLESRGACNRLYLHACSIAFLHPATDRRIEITAPEPPEFERLWRTLGS